MALLAFCHLRAVEVWDIDKATSCLVLPKITPFGGLPRGLSKESTCNAGDLGFNPWVGKIPWRRKWLPTSVFFLENPMGGEAWWATVQFSSVALSCPTLCHLMDCSTPGFPVLHYPLESAQTHVLQVGDAIQPAHPLSSPSPPAFNLSQHQDLFQ